MKSLEEIHKIREEKRKELDLRVNTKADTREKHILVCWFVMVQVVLLQNHLKF